MTEDKKAVAWAALKQAAETIIGWVRNFWRNLQQLGSKLLEAMRKNARPKKLRRKQKKERDRRLAEAEKQRWAMEAQHPYCRHQVTPYNPHVREHEGPIGWLDQQEQGYALVSHIPGDKPLPGGPGGTQEPEKYPTIKGQSASADQVREAMIDMANAAADGFKQGVESQTPIGQAARQMGKTGMQLDLLYADQEVRIHDEAFKLRTLSYYTGLPPSEIANMSRDELEQLYVGVKEKMESQRKQAAGHVKGVVSKLVGQRVADVDTTAVAQQVSSTLRRIHDAGYDPQAADEAKTRAQEVSRELLEERRQELQTALQYTKHTVKRKNLERQIASIDQQLAEIPAKEEK